MVEISWKQLDLKYDLTNFYRNNGIRFSKWGEDFVHSSQKIKGKAPLEYTNALETTCLHKIILSVSLNKTLKDLDNSCFKQPNEKNRKRKVEKQQDIHTKRQRPIAIDSVNFITFNEKIQS